MRFPLLPAIILLVVNMLVDRSLYRIIKESFSGSLWPRIQKWTSILLALVIVVLVCLPKRSGSDGSLVGIMWLLFAYITVYVPKYIYLIFRLFASIPLLWHGDRWRWLSITGIIVSIISFVSLWWGALVNRLNIQVCEVTVDIPDLPSDFNGFTIAQISDLHVGTFGSDTSFVSRLVDSINSLHPDLIVFTGDIVNRHSSELRPFVSTLRRLNAPYGVYSVMGNHDYGDYSDWPSMADKEQDVRDLWRMEADADLRMLNNSFDWIRCGADSIALIGVENIGDPPFRVYGDLSDSYPNISDSNIKILLSHNPAHWKDDIEDNIDTNVALTLSGHTHAMQIELFGWSPAVFRYDKWGGLYTDTRGQKLYVNIGAGTVGMPFRIGATPEITLFTLRPQK